MKVAGAPIRSLLPEAICQWLVFPTYTGVRGDLTAIDFEPDMPFKVKRTYFIHHVPLGAVRGCHAHRQLEQVIIPVAGRFTLAVNDGKNSRELEMSCAERGIYIGPMVWRVLSQFSTDAVCMVLASHQYSPNDYINEFDEFKRLASAQRDS